jgi:hypothetical protein
MRILKAYDEVIDFIAATNPSKVLACRPSEATRQRVADLIDREKTTGLAPQEKTELDHYRWLEHVMRMAKIRARKMLQSCSGMSQ